MTTSAPKKEYPVLNYIIVPFLTLIIAGLGVYVAWIKDEGKQATHEIKPPVVIDTSASKPIKPPKQNLVSGHSSLAIEFTDSTQEVNVECDGCKTFDPQPKKLTKSGRVKFQFSVQKTDNQSQTIQLIITNGKEEKSLRVHVNDPNNLPTITI